MKIQYKKAFLFVLISTMGIGIVTLSIAPHYNKNENVNTNVPGKVEPIPTISGSPVSVTPYLPTIVVTPTLVPSPTPFPVYPLEEDGYPAITKLLKEYYKAKLNADLNDFKRCLTNPDIAPTEDQLKVGAQFKEEYKKIKCYVKKGYQDGTYIVFVYYELKFINIETSAPAVSRFFVTTDSNGNLKIFSDELDQELDDYYLARTQDEDVVKLIEDTNKKLEKAEEKDAALKTFLDGLQKVPTPTNEAS